MTKLKKNKNEHFIVSPITNGWKVIGNNKEQVFRTKVTAVKAAKLSAKTESLPLIVLSHDGSIDTVNSYIDTNNQTKKLLTAKGSRKISNQVVRASIAKVMIKRNTNPESHE